MIFWELSVISLVVVLVLVSTEMLYRSPLKNYSNDVLIPALQKDATPFSIGFVDLVTEVCLWSAFIIPVMTCYVISGQRARSFYYITLLTVLIIANNVSKMSYLEPRPYWASDKVKTYTCEKGFGSPSGHAMTVALFCTAGTLDIISVNSVHILAKLGFGLCCLLYTVITCMTRLFLGVHTLD